jgi:hypothetical protein
MKRIALITALTALAAPASALAENSSHSTVTLTDLNSIAVTSQSVSEFGPWREFFSGMRFQAFRKKQHSDDGQGGPGLDDGRRDPSGEDRAKNRTMRRRQGNPGDTGDGRDGRDRHSVGDGKR